MGGRKLFVYVRIVEKKKWRLGRVEIATLRVGTRAKEGKEGEGGEKKSASKDWILKTDDTFNLSLFQAFR